MPAGKEGGSVLWQSARTLLLPTWAEHLVSFLIYAAAGYFLIELNNRFGIIRMRASVQTAIYFLLVTVCPEMHLPLYRCRKHFLSPAHLLFGALAV